jgi:hypothetical protein
VFRLIAARATRISGAVFWVCTGYQAAADPVL